MIDDNDLITLEVTSVQKGWKMVYIRLENGKMMQFSLFSEVSGISHGNLDFAMIEPKLFLFFLLSDNILHVCCPYTQPYTPTLQVYLDRCTRGEINP